MTAVYYLPELLEEGKKIDVQAAGNNYGLFTQWHLSGY